MASGLDEGDRIIDWRLHLREHPYLLARMGLQVEMHHGWPLSEVFPAETLEAYNRVLRVLLELNCVQWVI
jgi:hypothetical protein